MQAGSNVSAKPRCPLLHPPNSVPYSFGVYNERQRTTTERVSEGSRPLLLVATPMPKVGARAKAGAGERAKAGAGEEQKLELSLTLTFSLTFAVIR